MRAFGFAGFSGAGKTTLIECLIPRLVAAGLRVSLIKHAHHRFDIDKPGKDSWRHREAGASEVLIASDQRWALMHELRGEPEPDLGALMQHLSPCDLVLIEGYKRASIPKLEVHRPELGKPLLSPQDPDIVALASDVQIDSVLPQFRLSDYDAITAFVIREATSQSRYPLQS
jgi:molybdopterin-guanine dinucleotide biosynthesis protein B